MPEWVIVGEDKTGTPVVLLDWLFGGVWEPIESVKLSGERPAVFRDRWRAKRQARRWFKDKGAVAIRRSRL
jgi:hypothetical protein